MLTLRTSTHEKRMYRRAYAADIKVTGGSTPQMKICSSRGTRGPIPQMEICGSPGQEQATQHTATMHRVAHKAKARQREQMYKRAYAADIIHDEEQMYK